MASENFSFPVMTAADIAEALRSYGIAPIDNLRAEDIAKPAANLLPSVLSLFLVNIASEDLDQQLGFEHLRALDNPEPYLEGLQVVRLYQRSRQFLESIEFHDFNFNDLLHPTPRRVIHVLSAIINFLHFREERIAVLQPIVDENPNSDERQTELRTKIAERQKAIADYKLKEQMEEPVVQQLQAEASGLKQKIQEYNKQQLALRAKAKAIDEEKEEILSKISDTDFKLMKLKQENSKLSSKVVQSPEKLQRTLEEKKASHAQLKNQLKIAMQRVQEKRNTLEMYTKACEKILKHSSKMTTLTEQAAAAKAAEKEVKALKTSIADKVLEIDTLAPKTVECQRKALETEERFKAKEKETHKRIADDSRKMAALKAEVECKDQSLEDRARKVEELIAKASDLCSQADSIVAAAAKEKEGINAKFEQVYKAIYCLAENIELSLDSLEQAE